MATTRPPTPQLGRAAVGEPDSGAPPGRRGPARRGDLALGLLRAMRPKQWAKNVLVFAAPGAAGVLGNGDDLLRTVVAFLAFCAAASAIYIFNDLTDLEADRLHPTKCRRPIAAGVVPVGAARALIPVLLIVGLALAAAVRLELLGVVALYVVLTTAYTLHFKHVALFDVALVTSGFIIRAVAGGLAVDVPISRWFLIVTSFGSLFMVTGKRFDEHRELAADDRRGEVRPALTTYSADFLRYLYTVASSVTLLGYCLWAFEQSKLEGSVPWFELSIIPFTLAILRYALLLDLGRGSEPEEIVLGDRLIQLFGVLWLIVFACGVAVAR